MPISNGPGVVPGEDRPGPRTQQRAQPRAEPEAPGRPCFQECQSVPFLVDVLHADPAVGCGGLVGSAVVRGQMPMGDPGEVDAGGDAELVPGDGARIDLHKDVRAVDRVAFELDHDEAAVAERREEPSALVDDLRNVDRALQTTVAESGGELTELLHGEPSALAAVGVPKGAVPEDRVVTAGHDLLHHEARAGRLAPRERRDQLVG